MDRMDTQELISALADGQLRGEVFARAVEQVASDLQARDTWRTYHLIGDVLRSSDLALSTQQEHFVTGLRQRLQSEPRPQRLERSRGAHPVASAPERPAGNDGRWKALAAVASIAAVAAVGWNLRAATQHAQPQLAATQLAPAAGELSARNPPVMIRDPRLDDLLAAHRQLGGATVLQTPAGFLRNATVEGPAR